MSWAKYSGFHFSLVSGIAPATVTTDANGSAIDRLRYSHLMADLNVTVSSGTLPTLDVRVQDSADGSTGWANFTPNVVFDNNLSGVTTAAFPQVTTTGISKLDVDLSAAKRYIRFVQTVGGTQPSMIVSVGAWLGQYDRTAPGA